MADVTNRFPENVPGRYYVDDQCIDCDQCRETAPQSFTRDEASGHSLIFHQPETPEEEALCQAAMGACPVEAIGDDAA
jgi:ferredoxin